MLISTIESFLVDILSGVPAMLTGLFVLVFTYELDNGDTTVRANSAVESDWTRHADETER
ncbi:hypothetical protein [Halovenus salina]|uniref:Uncharacterized protein n=1 Tax=Halovenus salina TaxID=1510225 RepID=A0ABD5W2D7_9EURY|nr:hypothetical protein [Halovenus salina]